MALLRGPGDDHPDGPDLIRDLVWMTALHGLTEPKEEPPEDYLFEKPPPIPGATGLDQKLDVVLERDTTNDCE